MTANFIIAAEAVLPIFLLILLIFLLMIVHGSQARKANINL